MCTPCRRCGAEPALENKQEHGPVPQEAIMFAFFTFFTLLGASFLAAALAIGFDWLLLHGVFHLMQPATARRISLQPELARGAARQARAYASWR